MLCGLAKTVKRKKYKFQNKKKKKNLFLIKFQILLTVNEVALKLKQMLQFAYPQIVSLVLLADAHNVFVGPEAFDGQGKLFFLLMFDQVYLIQLRECDFQTIILSI